MLHTIPPLFIAIALAFALASLRADLKRWQAGKRNIARQLDRIKRGQLSWTITERKP